MGAALYVATSAAEATDNSSNLADFGPDVANKVLENLSILNEIVLEWCERRGGEFTLPHITASGCLIDNDFWAGHLGLINYDDAWWWQKRAETDTGVYNFGILWLGLVCEESLAALDNPARIPVQLIGPRANECQE